MCDVKCLFLSVKVQDVTSLNLVLGVLCSSFYSLLVPKGALVDSGNLSKGGVRQTMVWTDGDTSSQQEWLLLSGQELAMSSWVAY